MTLKQTFVIALVAPFIAVLSVDSAVSDTSSQLACKATTTSDLGQLVVGASIQNLPSIEWGIRNDCFKKFGLTIKTAPVTTFPIGLAGLISNSYDLYGTTPVNFIKAIADGSFKGKIVASKYGYTSSAKQTYIFFVL